MSSLDGTVAIVTGGGGTIGSGACRALAEAGADVAVLDMNEATAEASAGRVRDAGRRALVEVIDLEDRAACETAVSRVVDELSGVDILVNCAQQFRTFIRFMDTSEDDVRVSWESGVMTTFRMMQLCHPHLVARGGGAIVNFGSAAGTSGPPGYAAYGSAKEGIRALTKVASQEWGSDRIRVNTICPTAATDPDTAAWVTPRVLAGIPLGRIGDPYTDVGAAIVYLAGATYVTGQTLMVDGGSGSYR